MQFLLHYLLLCHQHKHPLLFLMLLQIHPRLPLYSSCIPHWSTSCIYRLIPSKLPYRPLQSHSFQVPDVHLLNYCMQFLLHYLLLCHQHKHPLLFLMLLQIHPRLPLYSSCIPHWSTSCIHLLMPSNLLYRPFQSHSF